MFFGVVFSTHLLLRDSQQKQMDDCLVLFAATVAQSKLSQLCRPLSRIFPRIDLHNKNERSFGKFPFITNKYKMRMADRRLWTMDWH